MRARAPADSKTSGKHVNHRKLSISQYDVYYTHRYTFYYYCYCYYYCIRSRGNYSRSDVFPSTPTSATRTKRARPRMHVVILLLLLSYALLYNMLAYTPLYMLQLLHPVRVYNNDNNAIIRIHNIYYIICVRIDFCRWHILYCNIHTRGRPAGCRPAAVALCTGAPTGGGVFKRTGDRGRITTANHVCRLERDHCTYTWLGHGCWHVVVGSKKLVELIAVQCCIKK